MLIERAVLNTMLLATTAGGYSFFQFQQGRLERMMQRANLHAYRARLANADVHYWAGGAGAGRPLLLVHGFGADALWGWAMQAELGRDRFLIAPDLLWFGNSFSTQAEYTTLFQAQVLVELLDHLAIEQVDVVGISYGGFVALELAHGWSERVRRIVLVDSPGHAYNLDDYHDLLARKDLDSVSDLVVPDAPSGVRRLVQLAYYRPPPIPMFVARDIYANMFVLHKEQKVRLLDNLLARAATVDPDLYHIPHRTMVMWGDHDELFPPQLGYRLADTIGRRAHVELVPRANHAPNLERAPYFNRRVASFLSAADDR
jgi:pimeloyl-ACP methyl ester carboxylesterase